VICIIINYLAGTGGFNGLKVGDISKKYENFS